MVVPGRPFFAFCQAEKRQVAGTKEASAVQSRRVETHKTAKQQKPLFSIRRDASGSGVDGLLHGTLLRRSGDFVRRLHLPKLGLSCF